jgi:hypothetical protein
VHGFIREKGCFGRGGTVNIERGAKVGFRWDERRGGDVQRRGEDETCSWGGRWTEGGVRREGFATNGWGRGTSVWDEM